MTTQQPVRADQEAWRRIAQQRRVDSIRASSAAGSGHPTSAMSAAEPMAVLMAKYLLCDFSAAVLTTMEEQR
jgi:transketolase